MTTEPYPIMTEINRPMPSIQELYDLYVNDWLDPTTTLPEWDVEE